MRTTYALTGEAPCRLKRHRWLQFSLRTLLVLMLVFGAGFGWLAHEIQHARAQRKAIVAIKKTGGGVEYRAASGVTIRTVVASVGELLGEDLPGDVIYARLRGTGRGSDEGLTHLKGLTQFEQAILSNTQGDEGLAHLKGLTQLRSLDLRNTQVSDAGLVHLQGLTQLRSLELINTKVSDAGINELKRALPLVYIGHLATHSAYGNRGD